jgi:hypothetical protein
MRRNCAKAKNGGVVAVAKYAPASSPSEIL